MSDVATTGAAPEPQTVPHSEPAPATNVLRGKTALVTGASSGLGRDFARELAARGCALVLVARRTDQLRAVADDLTGRYGIGVQVIPLDLTAPDAPQQLYDQLAAAGTTVDVLVNNAGYGIYGPFLDTPWERAQNMLQLDVLVPIHLTRLLLPGMVARNFGSVLFIASNAAYQPCPLYAAYGAAKSAILSFGEALSYELRQTGVHCTVLSPGFTATEFQQVAGQPQSLYQRLTQMQSADVARIGIAAMLAGRPSVVAGRSNAAMALAARFLPRRAATALAGWSARGG